MSEKPSRRRTLDYRDFDALLADVANLRTRGYRKLGQWDLSRILEHLGQGIDACVRGVPHQGPWIVRRLVGPFILRSILKKRRMAAGIKVPKWWLPGPESDEGEAVDRFNARLAEFRSFRGVPHAHPFFGHLSRDNWEQLILVHAAHHLSFLEPASGVGDTAAMERR